MKPIMTLGTKPNGAPSLHVDLMAFEAPMKEALRRAAVFLGYAFHATEGSPLKSVTLKTNIIFDLGVPNPIPPHKRKEYQTEFRQWSIGQGLIEIDQSCLSDGVEKTCIRYCPPANDIFYQETSPFLFVNGTWAQR
jgi:hypothetical protein